MHTLLGACAGRTMSEAERLDASLTLADAIATAASANETWRDAIRKRLLRGLTQDANGQAFVSALADRFHRSRDPTRIAESVATLLDDLGIPGFVPAPVRAALEDVRRRTPSDGLVARGVRAAVHTSTRGLLHDANTKAIDTLVARRAHEATSVNVNLVGEVVLGEREAARRAEAYRALIATTSAAAVSIKLSSIASQISLSAFDATLDMLTPRLRTLYEAARARSPHVLVNLDMEGFDDLGLTLALHDRLSREPGLADLTTGVVLQAYLPDAHPCYERLLELSRWRTARGAAPLRVRIVKGANLSMERHTARVSGHPFPIHTSKTATDASFLALVERATMRENARVLNVGVASHNLFDLAFALVMRASAGSGADVTIEMLEGMADPLRRTLAALGGVLVYAPIVDADGFDAAVGYLVRRLEEATAKDHFLPASFAMSVGDARYEGEKTRHVAAMGTRHDVPTTSLRHHAPERARSALEDAFENARDTDWAMASARAPLLAAMQRAADASRDDVTSIVRGRRQRGTRRDGRDPSRPGFIPYVIHESDAAVVDDALDAATSSSWPNLSTRERAERLLDVAHALRGARAELAATIVLDGAKRIVEADTEVSEAIDFAEYYARSACALDADDRIRAHPRGVVLVASPWNFPLAIGVGGALGALAAGNTVLLKPSPKTPLVADLFVRLAHEGGVPSDALASLVVSDETASRIVLDPRTRAVVLTGSTATARAIRRMRPELPLFAETGGKNAMYVSALADRDLAIRDTIASAFGHAGQKCSATSLLVCEREVYEDRGFRERLADAAASLPVGSAWDPKNVITPLIEPPRGALARALDTLEPSESFLLAPSRDVSNPALVSPAIKLGVREGSFTHQTELFGPVLAMMCADSLDHGIAIANGTSYGLTGAIHTLDHREQTKWLAAIDVGNAYVNRGTTGAIVRRQPFGGTKASCFGPGAKAGGPNYVRQLSQIEDGARETIDASPRPATRRWLALAQSVVSPDAHRRLHELAANDAATFARDFARSRDVEGFPTQENLTSVRPRRDVALVIGASDPPFAVLRECIALATIGAKPRIVILGQARSALGRGLMADFAIEAVCVRDDADLGVALDVYGVRCLRVLALGDDPRVRRAAGDARCVLDAPSRESAYDTLLLWLEERSATIEVHRYGHPLPRALRVETNAVTELRSAGCRR